MIKEYVLAFAGGLPFLFPADRIKQVSAYVQGKEEGSVPVYRMERICNIGETDGKSRYYIFLEEGGQIFGVGVDAVRELHSIETDTIRRLPVRARSRLNKYVDGVTWKDEHKAGVAYVLNIAGLHKKAKSEQPDGWLDDGCI